MKGERLMLLKSWREQNGWTLARLAAELGVNGKFPVGTVHRWETGQSRPDADMIVRIEEVTGGAVTALDMHEIRLESLRKKEDAA